MGKADTFGTLFRKTRHGLGLTLRAFCHQNGFDAGNVSRIERGLVLPPKKDEGLEKYAKALKLRRGSGAYNRFLDLAAAETGRLPSALLEAQADKLPTLLSELRQGHGHQNWVTARHLDQWAESLAARAVLPQLVRRLAHATGRAIKSATFPALEQTQRTGLDGVIDAAEGDAFVPLGRSVWEIGVSKKPAEKAEADFAKRRTQKLGFDKKNVTYICVTPRSWPGKQKWVDAKNKLKVWKEVRVYDAANLEEWLELAPAVDVWLARQLEIRPDGVTDLDDYWDNLSAATARPLGAPVFLASRRKQADELAEWLSGPPGAIALAARSPTEAIDFAAAVVKEMKQEGEAVTARTVLVRTAEAWRSICKTDAGLILVANPDLALDPEEVAEAVRRGHHAVLPVDRASGDLARKLDLPRVFRHHLVDALQESGVKRAKAEDYARRSGGSITVLKRQLARLPGTASPAWCSSAESGQLVPLLLAGAWDEHVHGDRAALTRLAGSTYEAVARVAGRWIHTPDPPLKRVLSTVRLVSRDDSWFLLSSAIEPTHLERFRQVALEVLGENDPAFDLEPDERWMASAHGKVLRHSRALRSGISETLALLGSRPDRLPAITDGAAIAESVVREVLGSGDWKRWASLSSDLPTIAEAAPDAFLNAVERDLDSKSPVLRKLFEQGGRRAIFSSFPHTDLLRALEGLSWSGELARVSYVLAHLDARLGSGKTGNSPMASLLRIFLPWFPQTTAPVEERMAILRNIATRCPDSGWRLLLDLLPDQVRLSSNIHRPYFRDWALTWNDRGPARVDYDRQVRACAELVMELTGDSTGRLVDLIEHFENLEAAAGDRLVERLLSLDVAARTNDERSRLAEAAREKVLHHRRFRDAEWALPDDVLDRLDQVRVHLEPTDVVSRNAWLFNQIWEVATHEGAEVMRERERAIRDVIAESGWDGIRSLIEQVKAPDDLGFAVGRIGTEEQDGSVLPSMLLASEEQKTLWFARRYVAGRFEAAGQEWADGLDTRAWPPSALAEAAQQFPCNPHTWAMVAQGGKEAEREYWTNTSRFVAKPAAETVTQAVRKLLEYGRPFHAAFVIVMARHQKCEIDLALVADVLEAGMTTELRESEERELAARRHDVVELLEMLQNEAGKEVPVVPRHRVAGLEWQYLGLLDGHPATPVTLHEMLATDPKAFVDLLALIFSAAGEEADERPEPTKEERERATSAYRLLSSWTRLPGADDDGRVDGDKLLEWVREARKLADAKDRLSVCEYQIGEVLAHDRPDANDGGWPSVGVRDLIEEVASESLGRGFEIGIFNKRGTYTRSLEEGGEQERDLAKRYRAWADLCKIDWPRTAASLRRVAEGYEREAGRADAETEQLLS